MKRTRVRKSVGTVVLLAATLATVCDAAIMSGEERAAKLEAAQSLLLNQVRPVEQALLAKARDPFAPGLGNEVEEQKIAVAALSDDELLPVLAQSINPTGIFAIGGDYYLIFKEKRIKAGAPMPILYNGTEYNVMVTDITGTSYTVKLGNSELQLKLK